MSRALITPAPKRAAMAWRLIAGPRRRADVPWLFLVAVAYALAQLLIAVPHLGLGWDETVYVSQVDPRHPAAFFSAPRSRGISFLVAPVLAFTDSTTALRLTLAVLSAAALYAAYRVWQPLLGPRRTALAALLFAGLWTTVLYGPEVMPNLWVALAAVAAVGWFLRAAPTGTPWQRHLGTAAALAAATCLRFSDGVWLALPLLAAIAAVPAWRRLPPLLAVAGGLLAGSADWILEAFLRWGSVQARLDASSATEGGMGLHWAVDDAWRSLNGPLLCRPCHMSLSHPLTTLWWPALPLLALAACAAAQRTRHRSPVMLSVACAAGLAVPYLLLIDYSAPRFFLPAYALLTLPVACLAAHTATAIRTRATSRVRIAATGALAALLVLHLTAQYGILQRNLTDARAAADRYATAAHALHHLGLTTPCLVTGAHAPPIAYYTGCDSANVGGNNRNTTAHALRHRATTQPTAALAHTHAGPPFYAENWTPHPIPGTGLTAYIPPAGSLQNR